MTDLKLYEHCIVNHQEWLRSGGQKPPVTPQSVLWLTLLQLDRKMHFTGLRGTIWRALGVGRSLKNPNLCNV